VAGLALLNCPVATAVVPAHGAEQLTLMCFLVLPLPYRCGPFVNACVACFWYCSMLGLASTSILGFLGPLSPTFDGRMGAALLVEADTQVGIVLRKLVRR
jgi:hypothetical protein